MTKRILGRRDSLEAGIETALRPGWFVDYREAWSFVSELEEIAGQIGELTRTDPGRAVHLYDSFLAGCYEKAEELDDSDGDFGMFATGLCCGWLKARQAAGADPDETATLLLDRMANDPYGFLNDISRDAGKVMNKDSVAFEDTGDNVSKFQWRES